jgi:MYXO-CTERM domain-containing protein
MSHLSHLLHRARSSIFVAALAISLPLAAHAEPTPLFVPFNGVGNVSAFTATSGGWVGSIDQTAPPVVADPLALVSVVLFQLNAATQTLTGTFEFTRASDLGATLFGELTGSYAVADILNVGGQLSIDYNVLGGTGEFAGVTGFGLSFVDFNPAGVFNNYAEAGLLTLNLAQAVPEPATWALAAMGLVALGFTRRRPAWAHASRAQSLN